MSQKIDVQTYEKSLKRIVENLNNNILSKEANPEINIVISLSRKGPKLLEYLRNHGLGKFPFATEHALPFIFEEICKNKDKQYNIFIIDDAIYFGSTIQNLYNEIKTYIEAYQLEENVKIKSIVTAIKLPDSKTLNIDKTLLLTNEEDIRGGYGHFFIKHLMKDLSELNDTMEIEFPVIEYSIEDKTVDGDRVDRVLKEVYPNVLDSEPNDEDKRKWCILLTEGETESFNKIRVFRADKELRFVFMNPHYFDNIEETLLRLMVGQGSPFYEIWDEIQSHLPSIDSKRNFSNEIRRNILRTQVVLANFLLSFNNYLVEKKKIDSIIQKLGKDASSYQIRARNLEYIIGNKQLVDKIIDRLKIAVDSNLTLNSVIAVKKMTANNDYVLERNSLPKEELEMLQSHNLIMLGRSKNTEEALSAMFNNLTILIEKWTRGTIYDDNYRLRFGYSMKNLATCLRRYSKSDESEGEVLENLHKWMDGRIDSGCIVPQYIVDANTATWMRVFRPGENEDLLLSHLARLVLHVRNEINKILKVEKVNTYAFQSVLAVIIEKYKEGLKEEEPYLDLRVDETLLPYVVKNDRRNIVEYMKDMFILTEDDNGFLELSPRLIDKEFQSYTTLSEDLRLKIDALIIGLLSKNEVVNNPFADFSSDIYYDLKDNETYFNIGNIESNIQQMKEHALSLMNSISTTDGNVKDLTEKDERYILENYYKYIKPFLFSDAKVEELGKKSDLAEYYEMYKMEVRLQKILSVYNILLLLYRYKDQKLLAQYLKANGKILDQLGMPEIVKNTDSACERNIDDEFNTDSISIGQLPDFLDSI